MAVQLPSKELAATSFSRIIDLATSRVEASTDLRLEIASDTILERCREQTSVSQTGCVVRALRDAGPGRFLLVISTVGTDQVLSLFIDMDEVAKVLGEDLRTRSAVDTAISERAILATTLPTRVTSEGDVERYLADLFERDLSAVLEREAAKNRLGRLVVEIPVAQEVWVLFDGHRLGRGRGEVSIVDVPFGSHTLAFESDGEPLRDVAVDLTSARPQRFETSLAPPPSYVSIGRSGVFYGGVAAAAVGAGLIVASFVAPGPRDFCSGLDSCSGPEFTRAGGVLLAPLGYSFAGLGAAWIFGSWLGDERSFPWIELLSGAAIFGLSYGLSAVLNGDCGDCAVPSS